MRANEDLRALAIDRLTAVLGAEHANQLLESTMKRIGGELRTPQDLQRFSEELVRRGGFEGAVGALLGVAAVIRGATPTRRAGVSGGGMQGPAPESSAARGGAIP